MCRSSIGGGIVTPVLAEDNGVQGDKQTFSDKGDINLQYDTAHWDESGPSKADRTDNTSHDVGTYQVTIPTAITYENMPIGNVSTSDDYTVNVRGTINDGYKITLTAETGKKVATSDRDSDITEITTQGKTEWSVDDCYGSENEDGSINGTNCTDNIAMSGTVRSAGSYIGTVAYNATIGKKDNRTSIVAEHTSADLGRNTILHEYSVLNDVSDFSKSTREQFERASQDGIEMKIISPNDAPYPVYLWNDGQGNGYWYTEADKIAVTDDTIPEFGDIMAGPYSYLHSDKQESLRKINLTDFDTSAVTNMSELFGQAGCSNIIEDVDLSGWDVSHVTDLSCLFDGCTHLKTINLSGWNLSNIHSDQFSYCMFGNANSMASHYLDESLQTIVMKGCPDATVNIIKAELQASGLQDQVTIIR